MADITTQNFFSDFLMASALHEDTRYRRMGEGHKLWPRVGYAISRAVWTRTDSGAGTFNWANVLGTGLSAGLANAYYPEASRTAPITFANWGTGVAGTGLFNLMPEFWPDFSRFMQRLIPLHKPHPKPRTSPSGAIPGAAEAAIPCGNFGTGGICSVGMAVMSRLLVFDGCD
jgi:hypothetical protein